MKLVFSSAIFAAAAATSASASCVFRGERAASNIMGDNGCFPDATDGASSSDNDYCTDPDRAATVCETFVSIKYDDWCYGGFPSLSSLQDQCWEGVQLLEVEPVREDDEEEKDAEDMTEAEDADAPVLANTYLRARRARCGKYTAGTAAAQAGVNIVNGLWKSSGEDCRYATRQFPGDVQRALLDEFPDNCSDTGAFDANRAGRTAGENFMNHRVISQCSQPVPRPTNPPSPSRCTRGNRNFDSGVRLTQNLDISCSFVDFGDIAIQEELAKRNANSCVRRGAYDEFNRIKGRCGKGATAESGVVEVASLKGQNSQFEEQALQASLATEVEGQRKGQKKGQQKGPRGQPGHNAHYGGGAFCNRDYCVCCGASQYSPNYPVFRGTMCPVGFC